MAKMSIRIILRSGSEFTVKCDSFKVKINRFEQVTGIEAKGITGNKFLHLDFDEVAAIVRLHSDESVDETN